MTHRAPTVPRRLLGATGRRVGANLRARIFALIALTCSSLVVARTAGASGVGEFTLLRVLPWLVGLLLSNGVYAAAPFFLSGPDRAEPRFRTTIPAMALAAGVVGCAVWVAASPLIGRIVFPGLGLVLVASAGITVLTQLVESTAKACSQGSGDLTGSNRVIVLEELVLLPWYGVLLAGGAGTFAALVFALALGDVTTSTIAWGRLARYGYFTGAGRPSLHLARRVSAYGLRAEVGSVMQTLNARLDFVIVAALLSPSAVGLYAVASRYAELLRLPSLALNYVLLPAYARDGGPLAGHQAARALRQVWWTPAVAAVPMALLVPVVLPFAYGSEFRAASGPTYVLLAGLSCGAVNGIMTAYLAGIGRPGLNSLAIGAGLIVTVVLDACLIPAFHVMGAAAASTICYMMTTAVLAVLFRRTHRRFTAAPSPSPSPRPLLQGAP
jgi:O-antigen/teichoic acid export membrane protein